MTGTNNDCECCKNVFSEIRNMLKQMINDLDRELVNTKDVETLKKIKETKSNIKKCHCFCFVDEIETAPTPALKYLVDIMGVVADGEYETEHLDNDKSIILIKFISRIAQELSERTLHLESQGVFEYLDEQQ